MFLRVKLTFNHVMQICASQVIPAASKSKCSSSMIETDTTSMTFIGRKRLEFFQTSYQQNVKETSSNRHMVVYSVSRCHTTCSCLIFYFSSQLHARLCIGTKLTTLLEAKLDCHRPSNLPHWFHKQQWQLVDLKEPAYVKGCEQVQQC